MAGEAEEAEAIFTSSAGRSAIWEQPLRKLAELEELGLPLEARVEMARPVSDKSIF